MRIKLASPNGYHAQSTPFAHSSNLQCTHDADNPLPSQSLPPAALAALAALAPPAALPAAALPPPPFFPSTASPAAESASPTAPAPAADVMDPASSSALPVAPAAPPLPPLGLLRRWRAAFFSSSLLLPSTASPAADKASPTSSAPAAEVAPPARSRAPPTMPGTSSGAGSLREVAGCLETTVSALSFDQCVNGFLQGTHTGAAETVRAREMRRAVVLVVSLILIRGRYLK